MSWIMGEPFDAIGFCVTDPAAYHALAEEAHHHGAVSRVRREKATLHGCCWHLGEGLEVWTVLHESPEGFFYADCRPAFRSRHLVTLFPWEITEYEADGEAVVRAVDVATNAELVFELQNMTEINPSALGDQAITATVSGLAYRAQLSARKNRPMLMPLSRRRKRKSSAENDYVIRGPILAWRELKNPRTASDLILATVDTGTLKLEVLVNRADSTGEIRQGMTLSADVWLQGYILTERELLLRYEGVDLETSPKLFWSALRREH